MKKGRFMILPFSLLLLALSVFCGYLDPAQPVKAENGLGVTFILEGTGGVEEICPWKSGEGEYCVFLPGYSDRTAVILRAEPGVTVSWESSIWKNGTVMENVLLNTPYPVTIKNQKETETATLTFFRSGGVPSVYVDVQSGAMSYIHQQKGNSERGSLRIYDTDGTRLYQGNLESVKGRGNATWIHEKKPYNLKLVSPADLLGMGSAENWVLLANHYDDTSLRNQIAMDVAAQIGLAYTPQMKWVDLYLNGEYAGLYQLGERNEVHPQRVALSEEGHFLVSLELAERLYEQEDPYLITESGAALRIHSSHLPQDALCRLWQSVENAILAENGVDPLTGKHWTELIDADSWARKYLLEEVLGNLDAGRISQFFYCDGNSKIYAGPAWDFDVSMGRRGTWQLESVQALYSGRPHLEHPEDSPWYYALYQKEAFREQVIRLYGSEVRPVLKQLLEEEIPAWEEKISTAALQNQLRWKTADPDEELEWLCQYLKQRMNFLDRYWMEEEQYNHVQVYWDGVAIACYALRPGEHIPERTVPVGYGSVEYHGWYDAQTQQPFDFCEPVYEDKLIYLKQTDWNEKNVREPGILQRLVTYGPGAAVLLLLIAAVLSDRSREKRTDRGKL